VIIHTPTFDQEVCISTFVFLPAADFLNSIATSGSIPNKYPYHG
jgi:hypothetical protein